MFNLFCEFPFWPHDGKKYDPMRHVIFWSENHALAYLSSAHLLKQRALHLHRQCLVTEKEDSLLVMYLQAHCQRDGNVYEALSSIYLPYTISALLNLIDFSESPTIVHFSRKLISIILTHILLATSSTGVSTLVPSTRSFSRHRFSVHGHNINQIILLLIGRSPDKVENQEINNFILTTDWNPYLCPFSENIFLGFNQSGFMQVRLTEPHTTIRELYANDKLDNLVTQTDVDICNVQRRLMEHMVSSSEDGYSAVSFLENTSVRHVRHPSGRDATSVSRVVEGKIVDASSAVQHVGHRISRKAPNKVVNTANKVVNATNKAVTKQAQSIYKSAKRSVFSKHKRRNRKSAPTDETGEARSRDRPRHNEGVTPVKKVKPIAVVRPVKKATENNPSSEIVVPSRLECENMSEPIKSIATDDSMSHNSIANSEDEEEDLELTGESDSEEDDEDQAYTCGKGGGDEDRGGDGKEDSEDTSADGDEFFESMSATMNDLFLPPFDGDEEFVIAMENNESIVEDGELLSSEDILLTEAGGKSIVSDIEDNTTKMEKSSSAVNAEKLKHVALVSLSEMKKEHFAKLSELEYTPFLW